MIVTVVVVAEVHPAVPGEVPLTVGEKVHPEVVLQSVVVEAPVREEEVSDLCPAKKLGALPEWEEEQDWVKIMIIVAEAVAIAAGKKHLSVQEADSAESASCFFEPAADSSQSPILIFDFQSLCAPSEICWIIKNKLSR